MPPRKSNVSTTSNGAEEGAESTPAKTTKEGLGVEDLSLPKSMIARLAKGVLPANTQIHKDALLALHKSATVFVSYIASNSSENAQAAGKKTIMPPDVMAALKDAEFEDFIPRLEQELKKYNDVQCDKRNTYRRKVKEEKAAAAGRPDEGTTVANDVADVPTANGTAGSHAEHDDEERPTKKLKGISGVPVDVDEEEDENEGLNGDTTLGQDEDDDEEEGEDEEVEGPEEIEDVDEDENDEDQVMDEAEEDEAEDGGGIRDEALDEPDSD